MSTALQKVDNNALPRFILDRLSPSEKRVALASRVDENNQRISTLNRGQMRIFVDNILLKVSVRLGEKKKEGEEYKVLFQALSKDLVTKFSGLNVQEIYEATENGLDGVYTKPGEPIFFKPSNFVQWVRSYIEETKKPVSVKVRDLEHKLESAPIRAQTPKEHAETMLGILSFAFTVVATGKTYLDLGNILYRFLDEYGYITADTEEELTKEKFEAMKLAHDELKAEAAKIWARGSTRSLQELQSLSLDDVKKRAQTIMLNRRLKSYLADGTAEKAIEFIKQMRQDVKEFLDSLDEPTES